MSQQPSRDQLKKELGVIPDKAGAAPKVEKVLAAKPVFIKLKHHDTCPGTRNKECTCAANLVWLAEAKVKALERKTQEWSEFEVHDGKRVSVPRRAELWRVDEGMDVHTTRPGTSALKKPVPYTLRLPARWICTGCGWGGRGSDVSHRCDMAAVAQAKRVASIAHALTSEQKLSGGYRLTIWQDAELVYHLAEEWVENGVVKALVEIDNDGNFNVIEGALLSAVVDRFAP